MKRFQDEKQKPPEFMQSEYGYNFITKLSRKHFVYLWVKVDAVILEEWAFHWYDGRYLKSNNFQRNIYQVPIFLELPLLAVEKLGLCDGQSSNENAEEISNIYLQDQIPCE